MEDHSPQYNLSSQLRGHDDDVRGICICGDTGIATSSRDRTVRFWTLNQSNNRDYISSKILLGHTSFVGPLAWISPNDEFPEGRIVSGGMDTLVIVWNLVTGEKCQTLKGHQLQVTGITLEGSDIISSSVDCTLRRWRGGQQVEAWEAHKTPIQAVMKLPSGNLITGSSDNTVKLWDGKTCLHTFTGHSDTVQSLAVMPGLGFLSASHDGSIILWDLDGAVSLVMLGHTSIVYSVDANLSGLIVSGSKDCFAKIWKDGVCLQSIEHPGCVWDAKFLINDDIVTACSDGVVRVWTLHHDRVADSREAESYASVLSRYRERVGGLNLNELPGLDALQEPGTKDGQTKVVRDGDSRVTYIWNMIENRWDKMDNDNVYLQKIAPIINNSTEACRGEILKAVNLTLIATGASNILGFDKLRGVYLHPRTSEDQARSFEGQSNFQFERQTDSTRSEDQARQPNQQPEPEPEYGPDNPRRSSRSTRNQNPIIVSSSREKKISRKSVRGRRGSSTQGSTHDPPGSPSESVSRFGFEGGAHVEESEAGGCSWSNPFQEEPAVNASGHLPNKPYVLKCGLETRKSDLRFEYLMPDWPVKFTGQDDLMFTVTDDMKSMLDDHYLKVDSLPSVVETLKPGVSLSSSVIDTYASCLEKLRGRRFHIFGTKDCTAFQETMNDTATPGRDWPKFYVDASSLKTWDVGKRTLQNKSILIFPLQNEDHYLLLLFHIRKWELVILDPRSEPGVHRQNLEEAAYCVIHAVKQILYIRAGDLLQNREVRCYLADNIPKENERCDSGLLVCLYILAVTKRLDLTRVKPNADDLREFRYAVADVVLVDELSRNPFSVRV